MKGLSMLMTLGYCVFTLYVTCAQEVEMMPLEKLPPMINSDDYDEGSPVISLDGRSLYFTRSGSPDFERTLVQDGMDISSTYAENDYRILLSSIYSEIASEDITEPYQSPFNQDIWIAQIRNDTVVNVTHPGFPINNALPNSVVSARLDSHELVVINQFYSDGSMHEGFSIVHSGFDKLFSFPKPLHIYNFYNNSSDVNLTLSTRGQVMILSLERKDTRGQKDLYVSFRIQKDLWSEPQNLGPVLNSVVMESTPFISYDNRRLYFASDRSGGMGGMDIYVSERLDYTWMKWTQPKPLKAPINSEWDDIQPFVDEVNSNFYFSSRRDGSSDIFRLPLKPKPRLKAPLKINGLILDGVTLRPIRAELLYGPDVVKGYLEYYHTFTGKFKFELTEYGVYKFLAHKPGYADARLMFDTRLAEKANLPEHDVILYMYRDSTNPVSDPTPIIGIPPSFQYQDIPVPADVSIEPVSEPEVELPPKVGDKITFYNIYFERSKSIILNTSQKALDELFSLLVTHQDINVRIEGHTDNVGNESDLMELSWQRAQEIKIHLVKRGINPVRISTVGYGDTRPLSSNFTEEGRQKNRRVEVQVVE
jgi:outer membrane protein OmpA-like peptidoglycan-associated protein